MNYFHNFAKLANVKLAGTGGEADADTPVSGEATGWRTVRPICIMPTCKFLRTRPRLGGTRAWKPFDSPGPAFPAASRAAATGFPADAVEGMERETESQAEPREEFATPRTAAGAGRIHGLATVSEVGGIGRFPTAGDRSSRCRCAGGEREGSGGKKGEDDGKDGDRHPARARVAAAEAPGRFAGLRAARRATWLRTIRKGRSLDRRVGASAAYYRTKSFVDRFGIREMNFNVRIEHDGPFFLSEKSYRFRAVFFVYYDGMSFAVSLVMFSSYPVREIVFVLHFHFPFILFRGLGFNFGHRRRGTSRDAIGRLGAGSPVGSRSFKGRVRRAMFYRISSCFLINWQRLSFISACLGTGACLPFLGFA
jgi:hypothetical protein